MPSSARAAKSNSRGGRHQKAADQAGLNPHQLLPGKQQGDNEQHPGQKSPRLGDQQDPPPANPVRPFAQQRRPDQLKGRIDRPQQAVYELVAAELLHQKDQKGQNDTVAQHADEIDQQYRD
jgi:hypothetical protein